MKKPRLKNGQFASPKCPVCFTGDLQPESNREDNTIDWRCDGLIEPEYTHLPLECCPYAIIDGEIVGNT